MNKKEKTLHKKIKEWSCKNIIVKSETIFCTANLNDVLNYCTLLFVMNNELVY